MPTRNQSLKEACPLEAALDIIGGKWKGIIIYHLMQGNMRFHILKRAIPAITHRMLTRQLRQLENDGIVIRGVHVEGSIKVEYGLTDYGMELKPILLNLKAWGYALKGKLQSSKSDAAFTENYSMKNPQVRNTLDELKNDINQLLGFHEDTPRINYGPCGVFAKLFAEAWNARFKEKIHICFVLTHTKDECWHIVVRLPSGELYDGGVGIHADSTYSADYIIEDMMDYDHALLEKWSYGLMRTYPRFCPDFDKNVVAEMIEYHLDRLLSCTS